MTQPPDIGDITRNRGTVVAGNQGPVQTGDGQQIVTEIDEAFLDQAISNKITASTVVLMQGAVGQPTRHKAQLRRWVSAQQLAALAGRFVEPAGFDQVMAKLRSEHVVLISGKPGAGRWTASAMALNRVSAGDRIRQLDVDFQDDGQPLFDADQLPAGEPLLLDLSTVDASNIARVEQGLESLLDKVMRARTYLAVVLPDRQRDWMRGLRVTISLTPDQARQVFERHLHADHVTPGPENAVLRGMFESPRAGELATLADLVTESEPDTTGWDEALDTALQALSNWSDELTTVFQDHPEADWRSLMVSSALLEGCPADAVFEADRELLRLLKHPDSEIHPLARPGLTQRLAEIDARIRAGRVHFTKLRYGPAVLSHFWQDFPGLRGQLADWVQRVPQLARTGMSDEDRQRMADRFTEESLRREAIVDVLAITEKWAKSGDRRSAPLAARVLGTAALDPTLGWKVRSQLYTWAYNRSLSPELARTVIAVCVGVLGEAYPEQAIVRLHQLTRHQDTTVGDDAVKVLVDLAEQPRLRRWLLNRVVQTMPYQERDVDLFLQLAVPTRRLPRDLVLPGWRVVLQRGERWKAVASWLDAARQSTSDDELVDTLVEACGGRLDLLSALRAATAAWVGADQTARSHVGALVDYKIEIAQDEVLGAAYLED